MMVLYHLHNPDAPAFACTCNVCGAEVEAGGGFRCTVCPDWDACAACATDRSRGAPPHPHPLVPHARGGPGGGGGAGAAAFDATRARLTDEQRAERAAQLARTMALLRHASGCTDVGCTSSNCAKVKGLFHHAVACPHKVAGGCPLCRRMWGLLQVHAKQCGELGCPVPRCRELREARRRQAAKADEQRRAAYQQLMRGQAARGAY
jgi:E1A/CREB-binding protein